jgi:transposase
MNYCGIDIAMKTSYFYITDSRGRKKISGEIETTYMGLTHRLRPYVRQGLKIAIEAGNQTAWIYDCLIRLGAEVVVVNPAKVKLIAESRRKTDKIDAKILAELLRLDGLPEPIHMPGRPTRELRGLLVARKQLVNARTKLCNVARGMLRQEGIRLPARSLSTFKGWQRLLGHAGYECEHIAPMLSAYYESFVSLTRSIQAMDKELAQREQNDERAARLQTMPKVGRIASLTFLAAVDDVKRFSSSRKLVRYSGLCPTVRSSGERTEYGSISREGRSDLRAVWIQIGHLVASDRSRATARLRRWYQKVLRQRGKKTAVVALARKLLTIAYRLLYDETDYRSRFVSQKAA